MKCYSASLDMIIWFSTLYKLHCVFGAVQNRFPRQVWDVVNDYYSVYNPNVNVNFNYNPKAEPPKSIYEAIETSERNLFIFDRPSVQSKIIYTFQIRVELLYLNSKVIRIFIFVYSYS